MKTISALSYCIKTITYFTFLSVKLSISSFQKLLLIDNYKKTRLTQGLFLISAGHMVYIYYCTIPKDLYCQNLAESEGYSTNSSFAKSLSESVNKPVDIESFTEGCEAARAVITTHIDKNLSFVKQCLNYATQYFNREYNNTQFRNFNMGAIKCKRANKNSESDLGVSSEFLFNQIRFFTFIVSNVLGAGLFEKLYKYSIEVDNKEIQRRKIQMENFNKFYSIIKDNIKYFPKLKDKNASNMLYMKNFFLKNYSNETEIDTETKESLASKIKEDLENDYIPQSEVLSNIILDALLFFTEECPELFPLNVNGLDKTDLFEKFITKYNLNKTNNINTIEAILSTLYIHLNSDYDNLEKTKKDNIRNKFTAELNEYKNKLKEYENELKNYRNEINGIVETPDENELWNDESESELGGDETESELDDDKTESKSDLEHNKGENNNTVNRNLERNNAAQFFFQSFLEKNIFTLKQ